MDLSVKRARTIDTVTLTDCAPTLEEFIAVAKYGAKLRFSPQMEQTVRANRRLLERFLEEGRIIYGVTTGFGENVRYTISPEDAAGAKYCVGIVKDGRAGIIPITAEVVKELCDVESAPGAPF